jgi:hypothetical protein
MEVLGNLKVQGFYCFDDCGNVILRVWAQHARDDGEWGGIDLRVELLALQKLVFRKYHGGKVKEFLNW